MTLLNLLRIDPIPALLQAQDPALTYFTRRDLLAENVEPLSSLAVLPEARKIISSQKPGGSWRYPGKAAEDPVVNYSLLETFSQLGVLVEMYGFTNDHPAVQNAARYIFSCLNEDGALLGILGKQYIPYYQGVIMELLIKVGYWDDERIDQGFNWLLSMRQDDGGWIIPMQAVKPKPPEFTDYLNSSSYLKDYFEYKKKTTPRFSHRKLAKSLTLSSPSFISEVINSKKKLSQKLLLKLMQTK